MMRLVAAALIVGGALPAPAAWAQPPAPVAGQNPAVAAPGTEPGHPSVQPLNNADEVFLRMAAPGAAVGIELGRLAGQKARSSEVKQLGQRLVQDHTKARERLTAFARRQALDEALTPPPDATRAATREALERASGAEFDRLWLEAVRREHQLAAQLFAYEIGAGQNAELKGIAAEALPAVLEHLQMANADAVRIPEPVRKGPAP